MFPIDVIVPTFFLPSPTTIHWSHIITVVATDWLVTWPLAAVVILIGRAATTTHPHKQLLIPLNGRRNHD